MSITRRTFVAGSLAAGLLSATGPGALAGPAHVLRRAIPSSGEELPIIGLGTNRYGVDASEAARAPLKKALARFHEWGGKVVDTAPMYRTSESVLGDLISEQGIRDDLFIATKTDKPSRDESDAQMHDSLRKHVAMNLTDRRQDVDIETVRTLHREGQLASGSLDGAP